MNQNMDHRSRRSPLKLTPDSDSLGPPSRLWGGAPPSSSKFPAPLIYRTESASIQLIILNYSPISFDVGAIPMHAWATRPPYQRSGAYDPEHSPTVRYAGINISSPSLDKQ